MFFAKTDSDNETRPLPDEAVYILGANPLALYLASRFAESGERPLLLGSAPVLSAVKHEFVIKDERFINRQKFQPETAGAVSVKPKMLIITAESSQIKSQLLTVLPDKIKDIPIIIFTLQQDSSLVSECLRQPLIQAYFHGCLSADKNNVSLIGRQNNVCLNCSSEHPQFQLIDSLFREAKIETVFDNDAKHAFWAYLAPYAAISLLSAAQNKNIYHLTKDEEARRELDLLIEDLQKLALKDDVALEHTEILKTIYNIPSAYVSALQIAVSNKDCKEVDNISSLLTAVAEAAGISTPAIQRQLGLIYNKTLV